MEMGQEKTSRPTAQRNLSLLKNPEVVEFMAPPKLISIF
jgi:hypothetical protein